MLVVLPTFNRIRPRWSIAQIRQKGLRAYCSTIIPSWPRLTQLCLRIVCSFTWYSSMYTRCACRASRLIMIFEICYLAILYYELRTGVGLTETFLYQYCRSFFIILLIVGVEIEESFPNLSYIASLIFASMTLFP